MKYPIYMIIMGYFIGLLIAFNYGSDNNLEFKMIWRKPHA